MPAKSLLLKAVAASTSPPRRTLASSVYFYNKGFRFPYPYHHIFTTHTKGRWIGRTLPEIFAKEFTQYTEDHIEKLLESGAIKVNKGRADKHLRMRNGDLIEHSTHRHELPVTDDTIDFLHWDNDHFVVDKPASIPVHPCGHYRRASLTHILQHEYGMEASSLYPVHRLDRLTSGVLIIARTQPKAKELADQMQNQKMVKKCYLARVKGRFPGGECGDTIGQEYNIHPEANTNLRKLLDQSGNSVSTPTASLPNVIRVDANMDLIDCSLRSKWHIVPRGKGKPCRTLFSLVQYNSTEDESIVMCSPITGRTHQIRVHLQSLGFPISNDPCYGPEERRREFQDRFEYFLSDQQRVILEQKLEEYREMERRVQQEHEQDQAVKRQRTGDQDGNEKKIHPKSTPMSTRLPPPPTAVQILTTYPDDYLKEMHEEWQFDNPEKHVDPQCFACTLSILPRLENDYRIHLHSLGYEVRHLRVFSKLPSWANTASQEDVDAAWNRLKTWEDDDPSYMDDIAENAGKKTWKRRRK
uniref:Pseudouridine synthase RsuA/RluA-like domain-containing protein n=1 Tax=Percolomonas cosmopolitus TaxID=63605 RepID=A0A7S1KPP6_9EUKA